MRTPGVRGVVVLLLIFGLLPLVLVAVSSTAGAYVAHQRLHRAADAAAMAGALAIDPVAYYVHGVLGPAPLDPRAARREAATVLANVPGLDLAVVEEVEVSGRDVRVHLRMPLDRDALVAFLGLEVHARSHARLTYEGAP